MASGLVSALGGDSGSDGERRANPITHYKLDVADDSRGVPMFRVLAKHADGSGTKYQNLLVYLDSPDALRALAAALPMMAKAIEAIDAKQVALKAWPASATPKPAAAPEQPAAPPAPTKSTLASAFDDLPW